MTEIDVILTNGRSMCACIKVHLYCTSAGDRGKSVLRYAGRPTCRPSSLQRLHHRMSCSCTEFVQNINLKNSIKASYKFY